MTAPAVHVVGLDDWEIWQTAQRLSPKTIEERLRVLRMFYMQTQIQPATAQPLDIARWIASHDEWSDATTAVYTTCLSTWFKWLVLVDRRVDNPMLKVGRVRVPERVPRPIADTDVPKLLGTRMWSTTRVMIMLALLAGLRVHEIAKVRGEDFDLGTQVLWVRGKGRRLKSIPLHPLLVEIASNMPERGWWFPMRGHEGQHVLAKSVTDIIGRTMRRAGVPGSAHCLRHWYATSLFDDGADIRVVQELMRHKSLATTQIYTKVATERQREAIGTLSLSRYMRDAGPHRRAVLKTR